MLVKQKSSKITSMLSSLLSNFSRSNTPCGFYTTTEHWWNQLSQKQKQLHSLQEQVFPGEPLKQIPPKTVHAHLPEQFQLDYGKTSRPAFAVSIAKGRFWQSSAAITPDNFLLSDTSNYMRIDPNNPRNHPVFRKPLDPSVYFDKTVAVMSAPGGNTFFHWMMDVLPRYAILRQMDDWFSETDYFIVNDVAQSFQAQTLDLLGIPANKILTGTEYPHICADRLIVPSFPRHQTANIGQWVFRFLQKDLGGAIALENHSKTKSHRLFISRGKANSRRIKNEPQILEILKKKGFEKVFLEDLSIAEQIKLFSSAECIIAPHGAGLTNLVFCSENTKVLEIFSPCFVNACYWLISNQVNLDYYYLFGDIDQNQSESDAPNRLKDIEVSLTDFQDTLDLMEID